MNDKPIMLRGASAGSGKTHFLAKTYIRLLLERYFDPDHPKDVYDLQGYKVKAEATSLQGLAKGVYVISGKKIVVQ